MDGIILVNKEEGMNSRRVVDIVGKIIGTKSIGHTGTLDPIATGVLVLCFGRATKVSELITNYDKEYIAEVVVGLSTDTLDVTGNTIEEKNEINLSKDDLISTLNSFIGNISQEVPAYSAVKVNGKRLYKYARSNREIDLPKRDVEIYNISLIGDLEKVNGKIKFKMKCNVSKGTYIRSLIRDIGLKIGYPTCMSALIRTKQGKFKLEDCNQLSDIQNGNYSVLSIDEVLPDMETYLVDENNEKKIRTGSIIDKTFTGDICKIKNKNGELLAIYKTYELDNSKMKPYKMFV
jgi:tRNA pseudouridine55 synthase